MTMELDKEAPSLISRDDQLTYVIRNSPVEFVIVGDAILRGGEPSIMGRRDVLLARSAGAPMDLLGFLSLRRLGEKASQQVMESRSFYPTAARLVIEMLGGTASRSERPPVVRVVRVNADYRSLNAARSSQKRLFDDDDRDSDVLFCWIATPYRDNTKAVEGAIRTVSSELILSLLNGDREGILWSLAPVLATCKKDFVDERVLLYRRIRLIRAVLAATVVYLFLIGLIVLVLLSRNRIWPATQSL